MYLKYLSTIFNPLCLKVTHNTRCCVKAVGNCWESEKGVKKLSTVANSVVKYDNYRVILKVNNILIDRL